MTYVQSVLGKNERIVIVVLKHPIVLIIPFTLNLLLTIGIIVGALHVGKREPTLLIPLLTGALIPICFFGLSYLKWITEEYFITTHRVIRSEGIVNKKVSDSSLEMINDVVLSQSMLGRLLNFGDVEILTASEIGVNDLRLIRNPVAFKTAMLNQKAALGAGSGGNGADDPAKSIYTVISDLDKLRKEGSLTDEEFQRKKTELLGRL